MKKFNIVLFGPPNSGKGTLASILSKELMIPQFGVGEMFRRLADEGNKEGFLARDKYWGKGNLVPDELTIKLVKQMLKKPDYFEGVIFDGFPRTVSQAQAFDKFGLDYFVIFLDAPEGVLIKRSMTRRVCKPCGEIYNLESKPSKNLGFCDSCHKELIQRDDDLRIMERIAEYNQKTAPLKDYYHSCAKRIDASLSISDVSEKAMFYLTK